MSTTLPKATLIVCLVSLCSTLAAANAPDPMATAIRAGDIAAVRMLLDKDKSRLNAAIELDYTPLELAAMGGHGEIAALLIANGARINPSASWDHSPLLMAASYGHGELAELLIAKGADPNAADSAGWTPLGVAASKGHAAMVTLLIKNGADSNLTSQGASPLCHGVRGGHLEVTKAMVAGGADVAGQAGRAALDTAAVLGHTEIVEFLISKGIGGDALPAR